MPNTAKIFNQNILKWFDEHGRKNLPWQSDNSYHVWISEIMLQQTQVKKVIDYFNNFISTFPTLSSLAQSDSNEILSHWSGLGYYTRARNIHKTAQICAKHHDNKLPLDIKQLMDLPGIGRTTAGAILSLATNLPYPILDGNVKRVISRVFVVKANKLSALNNKLWEIVEELMPTKNARNYNQALMDLGSMVCTRSKPKCEQCPLIKICQANQLKQINLYPQKISKTKQVEKSLYLLMLINQNKIYLQQRDTQSIWPQLWFLPVFESQKDLFYSEDYIQLKDPQVKQFEIKHILTHRKLTLHVTCVNIHSTNESDKIWTKLTDYQQLPHPTALVKIIDHYTKAYNAVI